MNITSDELYYAIKAAYHHAKDNPEDVLSEDDTYEDIAASASDMLKIYQGNIMAQRLNGKGN